MVPPGAAISADSVPPNELREPAGCCAMRRARATLRLTPGLRGNAQDELFLRPTGGIAFTAHDSPISFARLSRRSAFSLAPWPCPQVP